MHDPGNQPETLMRVASDMEAAMIVSTLAAEEIDATTAGDFTAGFRAEAPGMVSVLVRRRDLEQAQAVLAPFRNASPETTTPPAQGTGRPWLSMALVLLAAVAWIVLAWIPKED